MMISEFEQWLNTKYGLESELYKDLSRLIKIGVKDGWLAEVEVGARGFRAVSRYWNDAAVIVCVLIGELL